MKNGLRMIVAVGLVVASTACGSATGPDSGAQVEIRLSVSGGLAGIDWQYTLDGSRGEIIGDRCVGPIGCDWAAGQLLATISPSGLESLAGEFFARDFFSGPDDYGSECCDQFDYVLSYRDVDDDRAVRGSDGTIPQNIRSLILLVEQFVANARVVG